MHTLLHTRMSFWILEVCVLSCFSCVWLLATLWTVACQAPLSMKFSRQEYWSQLPSPSAGDLPNQGSNLSLLCLFHWQAGSFPLAPPAKPQILGVCHSFSKPLHMANFTDFPFKFYQVVCPTGIASLGSCNFKPLLLFFCLLVFIQHPGDRTLSLLSMLWILLNKEKTWEWVFSRELTCRPDNSSLKNFLRIFQPIWPPSVTARLLTFKAHLAAWWMVFTSALELQRNGWEKDKVKSTKLAVLLMLIIFLGK